MRKAIILLLVVSMLSLASCSNKNADKTTGDGSNISSKEISSVNSENIQSENTTEISSDSISSLTSSKQVSKDTSSKKKATSNKKSKYTSKAEQIKVMFKGCFYPAITVSPEKSPIGNNLSIYNSVDCYRMYADSKIEKTMMGSMNKSEFNKHKDKIAFYLKDTIMYAHYDAWEKTNKNTDEMLYFYYLGKVDEYNLFAIDFVNGDMLMDGEFNRLAGYQFLSSPYISRTVFDNTDKYGNIKTNIKDRVNYSGIVLEKGGKYYTIEDMYLDNLIFAETVGKIYNALPKRMQMGVFDDYKDAYCLTPWNLKTKNSALENDQADFISYYDKDGKFHVVYADD